MTDQNFEYRDYSVIPRPTGPPPETVGTYRDEESNPYLRYQQECDQVEKRQAQWNVQALRYATKLLGMDPTAGDAPGALATDEAREQASASAQLRSRAAANRKSVEAETGRMLGRPPTDRGLDATKEWLERHKPVNEAGL
jgi:hypothetical protein